MDARNVSSDVGGRNYPARKIPAFSALNSVYLKAIWVRKGALVREARGKKITLSCKYFKRRQPVWSSSEGNSLETKRQ